MFVLSHALSSGQTYRISMNESDVSLVASVGLIEVSLPSGDSGYLDLFYGGTFSGETLITEAFYPGSGGTVEAQPPVANSATASDNTMFMRYFLTNGINKIKWPVPFRFPSSLSYELTGSGGWVNIFGELGV